MTLQHLLSKSLRAGKPQMGLAIAYPSPGAIERIGGDWDWLFIDEQHGELGYSDILALVRACDLVKRPALVRVSDGGFGQIGKALDTGAAGVIIPCIDTKSQAQAVVKAAKFPPVGGRSYGGRRVIDVSDRNYSDNANYDTLCIVQIESPQAIENAHEIAELDGIDALFLGPDDILLRRGIDVNAPRNKEVLHGDMKSVAAACKAHGKIAAMISVDPEVISIAIDMGFTLIGAGSDSMFLASGSRQAAAAARGPLLSSIQ